LTVALALESRRVGDITVVTCHGRLVSGAESKALQDQLDQLIPANPHIVLHLGGIDFVDSGGLGLLVRCLTRAKNAHGDLKVCAVSPKVAEVLRVTRLQTIFHAYNSEAEAIADAHRVARQPDFRFLGANVLCIDQSPDLLAYVRELLKEAGYRVITAGNFPDALILFKATRPKVIVMSAELRAARGTRSAEEFQRLANTCALVELPAEFPAQEAGEAAENVIKAVRASLPLPPGAR
jgi:anti-sigma B factor antagonist